VREYEGKFSRLKMFSVRLELARFQDGLDRFPGDLGGTLSASRQDWVRQLLKGFQVQEASHEQLAHQLRGIVACILVRDAGTDAVEEIADELDVSQQCPQRSGGVGDRGPERMQMLDSRCDLGRNRDERRDARSHTERIHLEEFETMQAFRFR